jgi:hypothetical protein
MILRSFGELLFSRAIVEDELHLFLDCPSDAHLRQDFFGKIKSILGEVNQKVFNKCQMIALLNSIILNLHRVDLSSLNLHISVYAGLSLILNTF